MSKQRREIKVALGERLLPVGELIFEADGARQSSMFRYAPGWLAHPERFALSPSMPLAENRFFYSGGAENPNRALPGPVGDSTPDKWGRSLINKTMGRPASELDILLGADDGTRQGALRYLDEDGRALSQKAPPIPRMVELKELSRLIETHEHDQSLSTQELLAVVGSAGSLGGARPKANCIHEGLLCIAKFTSPRDGMAVERMEVAALNMAAAAGIQAAKAQLAFSRTARPVAIITRFDRREGRRVPYLSGQSFLGKSDATGGFYTDIADQMRVHCADCGKQLEELHRRIMFTILVSNNDDHLKNHGFLYAGNGQWKLSPAFDINPQPQRHQHLETGISELSGNEASIEAALEAAPFFDVSEDRARSNLRKIIAAIDGQWQGQCKAAGMSARDIAACKPAFEHPEASKAKRFAAGHPIPKTGYGAPRRGR